MSWFSIFKKVRDESMLSDDELSLIEGLARNEVESVFKRNGHEPENGTPVETKNNGHNRAFQRAPDKFETLARSSKRVSILPFRDWQTPANAACELGLDEKEIIKIVEEHKLARMSFSRNAHLVHVRQIAYWLEHKRILDVDMSIFDGWARQADISRDTGINPRYLSAWANEGKLAVYKPAPRLVLLNEKEVYQVATSGK